MSINSVYSSTAQSKVKQLCLLEGPFGCVLQMPTGSGKTWLSMQAIRHAIGAGRRAIYLVPIRALASELFERWTAELEGMGKVGVFTGDFGKNGSAFPVPFEKAQLLIMTPERLDACTRHWRSHWNWIPEVDVAVVDELHLLGDGLRGARLEGALMRLRRLNPFVRVVGLSATLGNRVELANWLNSTEFESTERPVPLRWRIARFRRADEKPRLVTEEVSRTTRAAGKSIVFTRSRRRAESLSEHLRSQGLRAVHHHAGLDRASRTSVEREFRESKADVLVATSTLEVGINLPARQVVLYDLQHFNGSEFVPLSVIKVWQRAGRAGRPGLDTEGEAVLLAPAWDGSCKRYESGRFEPVASSLSHPAMFAEQLLAEVSSGLSRTVDELSHAFRHSLAYQQQRLPSLANAVKEMCDAEMLVEVSDENGTSHNKLKATRLGRIATRHMLNPSSILTFKRASLEQTSLTLFDWLLVACATEDCEPVLPVDFESLNEIAELVSTHPSQLLQLPASTLATLLGTPRKRILAAVKMALVCRAWTENGDINEVAETHDCYPFEVSRLTESVARLITAGAATVTKRTDDINGESEHEDLASRTISEEPSNAERLTALAQMLEAGLNEEAISLTGVDGIGSKWAKALYLSGVCDIEDLAQADATTLMSVGAISPNRANKWIENATELLASGYAWRFRDFSGLTQSSKSEWPSEIDPYRLHRANDLLVERIDIDEWRVTGGLDPHLVRVTDASSDCDCLDSEKGNQCKHVLAVRLSQGDSTLKHWLTTLLAPSNLPATNLHALWIG